ncbi:MAG TPA: hypothetical protein VMI75_22645 [Polyangiaceae bacterium]|nr:hypothetical protein [Polyangiaceae bacterium]
MNQGGQQPPGYPPGYPQAPQYQASPYAPNYGASPYAAPVPVSPYAPPGVPPAQPHGPYGDRAGEHLRMKRGRFRATVYVFFAFLMQMAIVAGVFALIGGITGAVGNLDDDVTGMLTLGLGSTGAIGGGILAYFVFRDRWKCIEAFSSRFCSGLMNLSVMYVPFIALVYANVRGIQKLSGK